MSHNIRRNARHVVRLIHRAADAGADVAHFPECAVSGYGPATWPDWVGFDWGALAAATAKIQSAACERDIWVVVGSVYRPSQGVSPTNSLHVFNRSGLEVGRYDKRRCSVNDLRAFKPGTKPEVVEIDGVRCGLLICLDWAFPELWQAYAADGAELVFLSSVSDDHQRDHNHAHTIPSLMQGYAFLHQFAVSTSNSARSRQAFPSFWVERSGHMGRRCRRDRVGMTLNALAGDLEQDKFFEMVRRFRKSATDGSLYAHCAASEKV